MTHDVVDVLGLDEWIRSWSALGAPNAPVEVHAQLLSRYSEPHRAYHTTQHLRECLALSQEFATLCALPAEVDIALWFHDAIYEPARNDNEARSADWLDAVAAAAAVPQVVRDRLRSLVMATRHSAMPATPDEAVLVDIDLAILGAPPERFAEYEMQVRREYSWVPGWLYRRKRREILAGFLARDEIYSTLPARLRFEARARRNLKQSVEALG